MDDKKDLKEKGRGHPQGCLCDGCDDLMSEWNMVEKEEPGFGLSKIFFFFFFFLNYIFLFLFLLFLFLLFLFLFFFSFLFMEIL